MDRRMVNRSSCVCVALVVLLASFAVGQNIINTVAGGGPNGLPATASAIGTPWKVVQQPGSSNFFISDPFSNRVFKVDSTGKLTVVAGNILSGYTLDGQLATIATLDKPQGIAVDSAGDLYIADTSNNVIRVVDTTGHIHTLAGNTNGQSCSPPNCGDGGPATQATFNSPGDVALDSSGNLYIADTGDDVIRVINASTGTITRVAGNYTPCSASPCGDGSAASSAQLNNPAGVWLDGHNNIYIADTANDAIRVVNTQSTAITIANVAIQPGTIKAIAGSYAPCSVAPCGDGNQATSVSVQLTQPDAAAADSSGNVYISDTKDQVVRVVTGTGLTGAGTINLLAGTYNTTCTQAPCGDGGAATSALFSTPIGVSVDASNNLYIADSNDDAIREIKSPVGPSDNIETAFGIIFNTAYSGDGNPATEASLYTPSGTAADAAGNIYIADAQNDVVRVVNTQSSSITIAGVTIAPGDIATVAGNGTPCRALPCGDDGPASQAQLDGPSAVALDASGNIYIADALDSGIRVVNTQASAITIDGLAINPGFILTVAGNGQAGYNGDGLATSAELNAPFGVTLDKNGNIYIADGNNLGANNDIIRVVNTQSTPITIANISNILPGYMATVAGTPKTACPNPTGNPACGDGNPATQATLNSPTGLAVDGSGNIYIADFSDNRIRQVSTAGIINTIAGIGTPCPSNPCGDGNPATQATLDGPFDVFVDYAGTVYVADLVDSVVRSFPVGGDISTVVGTYTYGFQGDGGLATSAWLAEPAGLGADASGDLLVTDAAAFRVRSVSKLVATAATAVPSPSPLTLPGALVKSTSKGTITITNNGNLTNLSVTKVATSGTNAGDFGATPNNCTTVPPDGGTCTITVSFTPSATGIRSATLTITDNATSGQQTVSLSGAGLEATASAITSSSNPSVAGSSVILTATVTANGATPGGTVTFNDGSTPLGSAIPLNSKGVAQIETSSLSAGTHSITAAYSGEVNQGANAFFAASTSPSLQQVVSPGFQISPTSRTISAGGSATYSITVSKTSGFSGAVTLSCVSSSVPTGAACGFSPNPVAPGSSSTLTITTTAATSSALIAPATKRSSAPFYAVWLLLPAMLLSTAGLSAPKRKKLISYFLLTLAVAGVLFLVACGGGNGSSSSGGGGTGGTGTPAGTYSISVQGVSGSTTSTQVVTLVVQ